MCSLSGDADATTESSVSITPPNIPGKAGGLPAYGEDNIHWIMLDKENLDRRESGSSGLTAKMLRGVQQSAWAELDGL